MNEVISLYLEAVESGRPPDRGEFISRYPELAPDLAAFLDDQDHLCRILDAGESRPPPPPPAPSLDPEARRFADYELLGEIACGGMGVVYRAMDLKLHRIVALKTILAGRLATAGEIARFRLEAEAAAGLEHPNIVPIHEVGEYNGQHFYSMKFIDGGNLAAYSSYFTTDFRAAARLIQIVALAVNYAHQRGVLHRDLKPGNILIDRDGRPYVTDFGLAKRIEGPEGGSITNSEAIIGSPSYMSPEQALGLKRRISVATDVYSLGAILYELATGMPPFKGNSMMDTLQKVIHDEPPRPSQVRPTVPRDLETICLKCLEKDPLRRYSSAQDLAEDLQRYLAGTSLRARPTGTLERGVKWVRRRPAVGALVAVSFAAVLTLLALSFWYNAELRDAADREHVQATEAKAQELLARRYACAASVKMAFDAWDQHNCDRARELLARVIPRPGQPDLRSLPWYHLWRLSHMERFTLRGHMDIVKCVAFSPDSRMAATASHDHRIKLWDVDTGAEIATLEDDPSHVDALAFSPDGATLASSNSDFLVRLWDLKSRRVRSRLPGHTGSVNSIAFAPDGKTFATGSQDRTVKIWDAGSLEALKTLRAHADSVNCVAFSRDSKLIASAGHDYDVIIWSSISGTKLATLSGHSGPVYTVAFSGNAQEVASGGWDKTVRFWSLSSKEARDVFSGHGKPVTSIAYSPDSQMLATASDDNLVKLIHVSTAVEAGTLKGHGDAVTSVAFSPDGRWVVSGSADRTAKLWSSIPEEEPATMGGHSKIVRMAAFFGNEKRLVTASDDLVLRLWDLEAVPRPRMLGSADLQPEAPEQGEKALAPDGSLVAVAGADGSITIWHALLDRGGFTLRKEDMVRGHGDAILDLTFTPDSRSLVSSGRDRTVRVWSRHAAETSVSWVEHACLQVGADDVTDMAVSPDGQTLVMARKQDPAILVWSLALGTFLRPLEGHVRWVISLAFSSDSRLLAAGSIDGTVRVWDLSSGPAAFLKFHAHGNAVASLAFPEGGQVLATGSDDGTVSFWDLLTGDERAALTRHQGEVEVLLPSRDSKLLVTTGGRPGEFGEAFLWRGTDKPDPVK